MIRGRVEACNRLVAEASHGAPLPVAVSRFQALKPLITVLVFGGTIAAIAPFDYAFEAITQNLAVLRVCMFVALASVGAFCANRAGFRVQSHGTRYPALIGLGGAILVAIAVALIDGFLFRVSLTPEYVQLFATVDLPTRLAYFMLRAFNENVFYRLFLFSALAWLFGTVWRDASQRPAVAAIWGAMIVAQITNIAINVVLPSVETVTPTVLLYDAIRYVAPGVVWAYHFARFGFATAEIASVSCHLFLQPALGILIR